MKQNSSRSQFFLSAFQDEPLLACPSRSLTAEVGIVHRYPNLMPIRDLTTEDARMILHRYRMDNSFGPVESACEVFLIDASHEFFMDVVVCEVLPSPAVSSTEAPGLSAWRVYCQLFSTHSFLPPNGEYDPTQPPFGL